MKIPAYMRKPIYTLINLNTCARILEIEAALYSKDGQREAASALRNTAACLKRVGIVISPATAFGWPDDDNAVKDES